MGFMTDHINPHSMGKNLSEIVSLSNASYPSSRTDLAHVLFSLPLPPSHDDLLFMAQLLDSFYGLLRSGEPVVPDNPKLRVHGKLTLRTSVSLVDSHYSFVLYSHKADVKFEGSTNAIQQIQTLSCWSSDSFRIYIHKNPAL
ncbi:hypothetical protein K503DRAFT_825926, partial [Rhizopogon vinicolor AM-OR11-026]